MPTCLQLRSMGCSAAKSTRRTPSPTTTRQRDRQLREIFEITCELATFPPAHRFVDLQRQLSAATDTQAGTLAARPLPGLAAV